MVFKDEFQFKSLDLQAHQYYEQDYYYYKLGSIKCYKLPYYDKQIELIGKTCLFVDWNEVERRNR